MEKPGLPPKANLPPKSAKKEGGGESIMNLMNEETVQ
jgi:hypothetical protein